MAHEWLLLDEPYVVETTHFLLSPRCFIGVVCLKSGDPKRVLVVDEYQKIWSIPTDAVQSVEKQMWPEWAIDFIRKHQEAIARTSP